MATNLSQLVLPIALCNPNAIHKDTHSNIDHLSALAHASCSAATPSSLVSWGFNTAEQETKVIKSSRCGAAMGCADGSLYLFHLDDKFKHDKDVSGHQSVDVTSHHSEAAHVFQPRRPSSLHSPRSSSPSPSSSRSNLGTISMSKSRAVSGLSKEQVEAPKNYVDFDEEQEKLREILKDRGVKDRTITDTLIPNFEKPFAIERSSKPLFQVASSSSLPTSPDFPSPSGNSGITSPSTPMSISPPPSPTVVEMPTSHHITNNRKVYLALKCHIATRGLGSSITAMKMLQDGQILVTLHEHGLLSLFDTQDGNCVALESTESPPTLSHSVIIRQTASSYVLWSWRYLYVYEDDEAVIVVLCAGPDPSVAIEPGDSKEFSRICLFQVQDIKDRDIADIKLIKIGDIIISSSTDNLCFLRNRKGDISIVSLSPSLGILIHPVKIIPSVKTDTDTTSSDPNILAIGPLTLPNPFKALRARPQNDKSVPTQQKLTSRLEVGESLEIGKLSDFDTALGMRLLKNEMGFLGAAWSSTKLAIYSYEHDKFTRLCILPFEDIKDVLWSDSYAFSVVFTSRIEIYALQHTNNAYEIGSERVENDYVVRPELTASAFLKKCDIACAVSQTQWLTTHLSSSRKRRLELYNLQKSTPVTKPKYQKVWSATSSIVEASDSRQPYITSILPLELTSIIVGYSDGSLRMSDFSNLLDLKSSEALSSTEVKNRLNVMIIAIFLVYNTKTNDKIVVGSGDDGSIAFWDLNTLQLRARRILFALPMTHVVQMREEAVGRLRDCVLCVSQDGTIAVIAIDTFELLYMIPGAPAPLHRICIGGDNLLLVYTDNRARLWDVKTRELWRSMERERASSLLEEGDWSEVTLTDNTDDFNRAKLSSLSSATSSYVFASTILIDIATIFTGPANRAVGEKNATRRARLLDQICCYLRILLPYGLDDGIDMVLHKHLKQPYCDAIVGVYDAFACPRWIYASSKEFWQISANVTASRLLIIVVLLRIMLNFQGFESFASTTISFYTTALSEVVGRCYIPPDLAYLSRQWSDSSFSDIRQAARTLFEAEVVRLPEKDIISYVERWQHRLPCLLPDVDKQSSVAASSLHIIGNIAVERYILLSTGVLTDISKSIIIYLFDEDSPHRAMAIDLCSRGFQIWQQYFDAVAVLRMLFSLATDSKKENISTRNMGVSARSAVLQIASGNTPLFMATLSLDILHPQSVEYSKSIMQLIAYLISKKPLVLYPNLPRLMEAVVKSLDPNSSSNREAILDSATEILGQVVRTYSTVDFHMGTQRLAVGTNEGAIIMYDLKTATRLYVLEGHRKRLAAISFSPDGRRLVTVSLEEGRVFVWKVGSSFTSLFKPGAPPRQGHAGSEPFKTLNFNVGEQANMSTAAIFESLSFEWPSSRSVKIKIRDSTLTFST